MQFETSISGRSDASPPDLAMPGGQSLQVQTLVLLTQIQPNNQPNSGHRFEPTSANATQEEFSHVLHGTNGGADHSMAELTTPDSIPWCLLLE